MRKIFLVIMLVFGGLLSKACDCIMRPIETYLNQVDVVFTGTVIGIIDKMDSSQFLPSRDSYGRLLGKKVRVLVMEKFKSNRASADTLIVEWGNSNCEPMYALGESYLFFAGSNQSGNFQMTHCTHWGLLSQSHDRIAEVKKALKQ